MTRQELQVAVNDPGILLLLGIDQPIFTRESTKHPETLRIHHEALGVVLTLISLLFGVDPKKYPEEFFYDILLRGKDGELPVGSMETRTHAIARRAKEILDRLGVSLIFQVRSWRLITIKLPTE